MAKKHLLQEVEEFEEKKEEKKEGIKSDVNRVIIIGDVHGCYDELMSLLKDIQYNEISDRLYFVGDLVVKGPKSNEVVEFVRNAKNCFCVMGNHDYKLIRAAQHLNIHNINDYKQHSFKICQSLEKRSPPTDDKNKAHLKVCKTISIENLKYLMDLPYYLYTNSNENILIVHAGILPNKLISIDKQETKDLMEIRNVKMDNNNNMIGTHKKDVDFNKGWNDWIAYYKGYDGHIFFGHDSEKGLQINEYVTGLDTGCMKGGQLTVAIINCDKNWNVLKNEEKDYKNNIKTYTSNAKTKFIYRLHTKKAFKVYKQKTNK
eukprot:260738_1